ncbi:MAG: glycosyl hydrolase family 28-related protein [Reyranellaceae bacterium]
MRRRDALALAGLGGMLGGALAGMPKAMAQSAPPAGGRTLSLASFGAKGDGASDDAPALQRALDETFKANDGTFLTIPPGIYRVDRPLRLSPPQHMTRSAGILAHGARLHSTIADGGTVLEVASRSTFRFLQIHGLEIRGNGKEGAGLVLECQEGGKYLYNFSLRDVVVQGCGGDGCRLLGNVFEGQLYNCYMRNNKGNGITFGHGNRSGILSAIHVMASVFGENGQDGGAMVNNCYDVGFHGCYFLLNGRYGLAASNGCTLLSHCGFENNHQAAADFRGGGAGLKLNNFGTLIGCTAYSRFKQQALLDGFVSGRLVMIGCTGSGGGAAKDAYLARLRGQKKAQAVAMGCSGDIRCENGFELLDIGSADQGGVRFSDRWDGRHRLQLGDYVLWVDETGALRTKKGPPQSDRDGQAVGMRS